MGNDLPKCIGTSLNCPDFGNFEGRNYGKKRLIRWPWLGVTEALVWLLSLGVVLATSPSASAGLDDPRDTAASDIKDQKGKDNSTFTIAIQTPMDPYVARLFKSIKEAAPISLRTLDRAVVRLPGAMLSQEVLKKQPGRAGGSSRAPVYRYDKIRGVVVGSTILLYRAVMTVRKGQNVRGARRSETPYRLLGTMPTSVLADNRSHDSLNPSEIARRVDYYVTAKVYEPASLRSRLKQLNSIELMAHFIPFYSGAERLFYTGQGGLSKVLGAAEIVGDFATFGLGSSVRIVAKGAAITTLTAASVRVAGAGYKGYNGDNSTHNKIDAFIATVEGLASVVTLVKVRASNFRLYVHTTEEAEVLGKLLKRSPEKILQDGFTTPELRRVLRDLEVSDHAAKVAAAGKKQLVVTSRELLGQTPVQNLSGIVPKSLSRMTASLFKQLNQAMGTVTGNHVALVLKDGSFGLKHWEVVLIESGVWTSRSAGAVNAGKGFRTQVGRVKDLEGGFIFKADLDDAEFLAVKRRFQDQGRWGSPHLSCTQDACAVLQDRGRRLLGCDGSSNFCATNLRRVSENGLTIRGRSIRFEAYNLTDQSLDEIASAMRRTDLRASSYLSGLVTFSAGMAATVLYGVSRD